MTFHQLKQKYERLKKTKISDNGFAEKLFKILKKSPLTDKIARELGRTAAYITNTPVCPIKIDSATINRLVKTTKLIKGYHRAFEREKIKIRERFVHNSVAMWENGESLENIADSVNMSVKDFSEKWPRIQVVQNILGTPVPNILVKKQVKKIGDKADF